MDPVPLPHTRVAIVVYNREVTISVSDMSILPKCKTYRNCARDYTSSGTSSTARPLWDNGCTDCARTRSSRRSGSGLSARTTPLRCCAPVHLPSAAEGGVNSAIRHYVRPANQQRHGFNAPHSRTRPSSLGTRSTLYTPPRARSPCLRSQSCSRLINERANQYQSPTDTDRR